MVITRNQSKKQQADKAATISVITNDKPIMKRTLPKIVIKIPKKPELLVQTFEAWGQRVFTDPFMGAPAINMSMEDFLAYDKKQN
jgi:hypothetical protein